VSRTPTVLSPELQGEAVRLVRSGMSQRAAARKFGISPPTLARYLAAAPPAPTVAPASAAADAPAGIDPNASALDCARAILASSAEGLALARANGDSNLQQRCTRDAAVATALVARLEKERHSDSEYLKISRGEIKAAEESLADKVAAILQRPLMCSACSRKLSATLAGKA
jgi:hypothetical protein